MKSKQDAEDVKDSIASESVREGSVTKKKAKLSKLDAAASSFKDMFSFDEGDKENLDSNCATDVNRRFNSMKKSVVLRRSSFFLPKSSLTVSRSDKVSTNKSTKKRASSSPEKAQNVRKSLTVTKEMIERVCKTVEDKEKLERKGHPETICHQCRIKSSDTKTVCRSVSCNKGRGVLCGLCLSMWYNEDAVEALKSDDWICPSCRGHCLCNVCRVKKGLPALSNTIASASLMLGFNSVKQYLDSKNTP